MKTKYILKPLLSCLLALSAITAFSASSVHLPNADFQRANAENDWPDDWPRLKEGGSYGADEDGNRFIRLTVSQPGKMIMLYREIAIPAGTEALELKFRYRLSDFQRGAQSWFDARIMMEFMDASRKQVRPNPPAPNFNRNQAEWTDVSRKFLVPEGAAILKFMPCLFNAKSGSFDLDDFSLTPCDAAELRMEAAKRAQEADAKRAAQAQRNRGRANDELAKNGTLIPNGSFEIPDDRSPNRPQAWGVNESTTWEEEDGNRFLRIRSLTPDKMFMVYREITLPTNTPALEISWKARVTGLKCGAKPWFDARTLFEFRDINGKKLASSPGADYIQRDTKGWIDRKRSFLVPPEAVTLVLMPSIFQAKSGTMDLDDFVLRATDPAPILAEQENRRKMEAARYVPPEAPDPAKFPPMLRVQGNRLVTPDGKEVWLQGVNVDGLETIPGDPQAEKSTIVAIEEWKSNCIRLPINEAHWWGKSPYQNDNGEAFRKKVDGIVALAANRGVYVVVDLHRFRAPNEDHLKFWIECAEHFKNHPAVLFDLFNEPHGISWEVWRNGGWVGNAKGRDESAFLSAEEKKKNQGFASVGMQALVDAIRSTGAKNICVAGGLFWANDLTGVVNGYALDDPDGNGIMYSWHTYHWHKGWNRMLPVLEKYPVFLGEVGAEIKGVMNFIPEEDQEDPYTFVPDMLGFIQKYKINWTGWCFHPRSAPRMLKDWSYAPTEYWGEFAREALRGKQFEMKKMR